LSGLFWFNITLSIPFRIYFIRSISYSITCQYYSWKATHAVSKFPLPEFMIVPFQSLVLRWGS
jgi:hypothetical protein